MPHAGHLCVAKYCQYKLNTCVGDYIVSTVGEYLPQANVREIFAESRGVKLEGIGDDREWDYLKKLGYEEIGYGRKYETMVFKARQATSDEEQCCPYRVADHGELDCKGYNDASEAAQGHWAMCEKWSEGGSSTP